MYEYALFFHILAMAVWLGSAFAMNLLVLRGESGKNPALPAAIGPEMAFFGKAVFLPSTLVALITGGLLVNEINADWSEPYIVVGLLMILTSLLMGPLVMMRTADRLKATIGEHGPTHPDVARFKLRLRRGAQFLLVLLLVTTFMMVVKPGT